MLKQQKQEKTKTKFFEQKTLKRSKGYYGAEFVRKVGIGIDNEAKEVKPEQPEIAEIAEIAEIKP